MIGKSGCAALLAAAIGLLSAQRSFAEPCKDLASLKLADVAITTAELVPAGTFTAQSLPPAPVLKADLPARCRVAGVIRPTADSQIGFEVWLPASGWSGRYEQTGNGGLAGAIGYFLMVPALQRGSATAATDDGHESTDGFDGRWAIGHPEKLKDYGYRAVHLTAVAAEALVRAYYGMPARNSYFIGSSDGGRESLMEVQRYPEDFDGYMVGAPGFDVPNNEITHLNAYQALKALGPDHQLTPLQLKALSAKVLEDCDALDGLKDGVLRDPRKCRFKAEELICPGGGDGCLTPEQAKAVDRIIEGPRDPKTGAQLAPGVWGTLGAEDRTWPVILTDGPQVQTLGATANKGVIGELVYGDPQLDMTGVDLAQATRDARSRVAPIINSTDPDLSRARALGRKIIHYHGWADPNVAPQYSVDYFEAVQRRMGPTSGFYRLFMVPGMPHCVGAAGLGANYVGIGGSPVTTPRLDDADHDWVSALQRWVEQGVAPDRMIATEFNRDPAGVPLSTRSTRPICLYPKVAVYKGAGPVTDAASFACKAP
jgi:feruloyl esterase